MKSVQEELEPPPPQPPSLSLSTHTDPTQLPTIPAHSRTFAFTIPPRIRLSNTQIAGKITPTILPQTMKPSILPKLHPNAHLDFRIIMA